MLNPFGAFSLSSGSLSSAAASGGAGAGASLAAAGLLSGRPISGEPGGSAAAAGAAAGAGAAAAGAGAGAGAGVAAGACAGSGAGVAAGAGACAVGAGACAGGSCGCWAMAVVARRASVAASNVPRGTRRVITFLPSVEVRSLPASLPTVSDISTPGCNRVAHDLANYCSRFVGASHAPIGVRRVVLQRCKRRDLVVARRKMADRVGGGGIAGERKGLAAAAAEVDVAAGAALARFFHPGRAAEGIEGRRILPDVGERMLAHRPEFEAGDRLGGMARQHFAGRR